jgi:tRNA (guanine-N7-)-methyltransferase
MAKQKIKRFTEFEAFSNTLTYPEGIKGLWHDSIFHNSNPITIELACGKGDYTIALATRYPNRNFIGIDRKGARMWVGAKKALDLGLENVAFLRLSIELIETVFDQQEVAEIWITFPDPFPKTSHRKRRLTCEKFLRTYRHILVPEGLIHLKTDDSDLWEFTRETIKRGGHHCVRQSKNVYHDYPDDPLLTIQTTYEKQHLKQGRVIKYISFQLGSSMPIHHRIRKGQLQS